MSAHEFFKFMCAFLRSDGGDELNNQLFELQSPRVRRQKLRAVLKKLSDGVLDSGEIDRIVKMASSHRQYSIALYDEPMKFIQAVKGQKTALPQPICEHRPMAAITMRSRDEPDQECIIHIYVPTKGALSSESKF